LPSGCQARAVLRTTGSAARGPRPTSAHGGVSKLHTAERVFKSVCANLGHPNPERGGQAGYGSLRASRSGVVAGAFCAGRPCGAQANQAIGPPLGGILIFSVFAFQAVPSREAAPAPGAPGAPGAPAESPGVAFGLLPLLILIPFALIMLWQGRSQQKKQEATISGLKKGDRVLTQSGLVGRLLAIEGRYAKLELPPSGTKVTILRSGLLGRDTEAETTSTETASEKPKSTKSSD
jgi:preprotein translocase subunit YajC